VRAVDPASGRAYYFNRRTKARRWDDPFNPRWVEMADQASGLVRPPARPPAREREEREEREERRERQACRDRDGGAASSSSLTDRAVSGSRRRRRRRRRSPAA
jgi:hypothetical protein